MIFLILIELIWFWCLIAQMIFLILIELIWFWCLLVSGDLFDAPGPPEPPDPTFEDYLKTIDPKDRHKVRFHNPDYDPKRGFHPHTNNPWYYPFRNYEEEDSNKAPKPDFFKKKMKVLLFFGVCCVLISGIPIIFPTPA
jgi:hypothetical protein